MSRDDINITIVEEGGDGPLARGMKGPRVTDRKCLTKSVTLTSFFLSKPALCRVTARDYCKGRRRRRVGSLAGWMKLKHPQNVFIGHILCTYCPGLCHTFS